jgi:hypothetical protein
MSIPAESLVVQKESPVDFTSLERYKVDTEAFVKPQKLYGYFCMLNGPTYENLVKDFWLKAEDAAAEALQKALELSKEIEVPASSLVKKDAAVVAEEVILATEDLQQQVTSEAENLMLVVSSSEDVQKDVTSEPVEVVNVESDSDSSISSTSSSSSDYDDIPLGQRYLNLTKGQPTSTKIHKKPSQTVSFEPMGPLIYQKIGAMSERRNQICERLPLNHPLQPQVIKPLNMVVPDEVYLNS